MVIDERMHAIRERRIAKARRGEPEWTVRTDRVNRAPVTEPRNDNLGELGKNLVDLERRVEHRARPCEVLLLCDVGVYWFHRACHHFDFLWRFHAVHHSAEHLDWVAAHREHPIDGLATQLVCNVPAFALGFPMETLAAVIALRSMWGIFIHSNVRLPLGPLRVLLGSPQLHHWHHARLRSTTQNFANLAPWVDVVFGTYHHPKAGEAYPIGLTEPFPKSWLGQLLHPLRVRPASALREEKSA